MHYGCSVAEGEDIAFGILEPGAVARSHRRDVVFRLEPGKVIVLEDDAALFERRDICLDVGGTEAPRVCADR